MITICAIATGISGSFIIANIGACLREIRLVNRLLDDKNYNDISKEYINKSKPFLFNLSGTNTVSLQHKIGEKAIEYQVDNQGIVFDLSGLEVFFSGVGYVAYEKGISLGTLDNWSSKRAQKLSRGTKYTFYRFDQLFMARGNAGQIVVAPSIAMIKAGVCSYYLAWIGLMLVPMCGYGYTTYHLWLEETDKK